MLMTWIPGRTEPLDRASHAIVTSLQHAVRRRSAGLAVMVVSGVLVAWSAGRWRFVRMGMDEIARASSAALLLGAAAVLKGALAAIGEGQALAERVTLLMNAANDAIFVVDERGRIVEANDRAVQAYGYARVELERMTVLDLRVPHTRAAYASQAAEVRARGRVVYETVHHSRTPSVWATRPRRWARPTGIPSAVSTPSRLTQTSKG